MLVGGCKGISKFCNGAVATHGHALRSCPLGNVRDVCLNNREFMRTVFANHGGSLYRDMTNQTLRNDPELIVLALHNGLSFRNIPVRFQNDQPFLCRIVSERANLFLDIPHKTLDLALAAMSAPDIHAECIAKILHKVPRVTRVANRHVAARLLPTLRFRTD